MKFHLFKTHIIFSIILLSIFTIDCKSDRTQKNSILKLFSQNFRNSWKIDSLGVKGFRKKCYSYDSINRTWLINGVHMEGLNISEITSVLGKPTNTGYGKEDGLLMFFYIVDKTENDRFNSKALQIFFNKNKLIDGVILNVGF